MTVREAFKNYFAYTDEEYNKQFSEFYSERNKARLIEILKAIIPFCQQYKDKTDDKIKHKVGNVLLSKLDYSTFAESNEETYSRLHRLFTNTTAENINPYKIIYCTVLTDAELKKDLVENTKYPIEMRRFSRIYDALQYTLKLSNQETSALFEKCSSLIAKGYSNRIPEIYDCIRGFTVSGPTKAFYVFKENEVVDILKINTSLLTSSPETILTAYSYIKNKAKDVSRLSQNKYYDDKELNQLYSHLLVLRKWLKNNSTLLTMNSKTMNEKYEFLMDKIGVKAENDYSKVVYDYFHNPITLAIVNQLNVNDIKYNAVLNIKMLEKMTDQDKVEKYLQDNPYFLAMQSTRVEELLQEIKKMKEENKDIDFMQAFLDAGKSLFEGKTAVDVEKIAKKLKTRITLPKIDIEHINGTQLLDVFCDVYNKGDKKIADEIKALIEKKNQRQENDEKRIRKTIRYIGERFRNTIPPILKDDKTPKVHKAQTLQSLVSMIKNIQEARFRLAKTNNIYEVEEIERRNSKEIEEALNVVREIHEFKKDKVDNRYIGGDLLFEKLMDYLSTEFDDKKSIDELFHEEVSEEYKTLIKEHFDAHEDDQVNLFGTRAYIVPKRNGKDEKIYNAMKNVGKEIHAADSKFEITFEK